MKHLRTVHLVGLFVHIHLCRLQKPDLQIEGIVFLVDTIGCRIWCEHSIEVIVLAVRQSEELFRAVQTAFCETRFDWKPEHSRGRLLSRPSST